MSSGSITIFFNFSPIISAAVSDALRSYEFLVPTDINSTSQYLFAINATRLESIPPEKETVTRLLQLSFTEESMASQRFIKR